MRTANSGIGAGTTAVALLACLSLLAFAPLEARTSPARRVSGRAAVPPPPVRLSPARRGAHASVRARSSARIHFAVLGDFGTGLGPQRSVAHQMCKWRRHHPFRNVITTGDNIYPDGSPSLFRPEFYAPYSCLLSHGVHFHASLGNHDVRTAKGSYEIAAPPFGMPARSYVLRRSGVRFVFADSNSLDRRWLWKATRARRGDRWTVVIFHHPVFSPGTVHGSTPGFRPGLPTMFQKRGVDLVLNGHDHIYAVTKPLHGIRYVVSGGGGNGLYGCSHKWYSARCSVRHHFLYVVVRRGSIAVRAVSAGGRVFAHFRTTGRR